MLLHVEIIECTGNVSLLKNYQQTMHAIYTRKLMHSIDLYEILVVYMIVLLWQKHDFKLLAQ